jgi:hypothetical protein
MLNRFILRPQRYDSTDILSEKDVRDKTTQPLEKNLLPSSVPLGVRTRRNSRSRETFASNSDRRHETQNRRDEHA